MAGCAVQTSDLVLRGRNIRQLTQKELARISGVPVSTISRIEAGAGEPAPETVINLMVSMGLKPDTSLTRESTDEQIEWAILSEVDLPERYDIYRTVQGASSALKRLVEGTQLFKGETIPFRLPFASSGTASPLHHPVTRELPLQPLPC